MLTMFPKLAPPETTLDEAEAAGLRRESETDEDFVRRKCTRCHKNMDLAGDRVDHAKCIWLHALRYAAVDGSWSYETNPPLWARPAAATPKPSGCALA